MPGTWREIKAQLKANRAAQQPQETSPEKLLKLLSELNLEHLLSSST